jgi:hypothetical protein
MMTMHTQPRAAQAAPNPSQVSRKDTPSNGSDTPAGGSSSSRKAGLIGGIAAAVIAVGVIAATFGGVTTQDKRDLSYAPAQEALYERHRVWYGALDENVARPFERVAKADAAAAVATMGLDPDAAKALLADIESDRVELGSFLAWDPDGTRGAVASFSLPSGWSTQVGLTREPKTVYVPLRVGGPVQWMTVTAETPNTSVGMGFSNRQVVTDFHELAPWKISGARQFQLQVQ